ncbi:xanthine dehydrogenase molybdopterin binding subunit [Undibacterium luofuense]|uniref:xanthine dehydrogenase molybdopterin binding subunit n=1 Tax=Undibacterium luofuense TaxID=2828733 RepID=UPI0030EE0007
MNDNMNKPVLAQRVHESAWAHVSGTAIYTDDIPELHGTLHAALGLSPYAHARVRHIDLSKVKASPGVIAVFTADDIPGENQCGPIIKDDPVLADGVLQYAGQPVFIVVAESHELARKAARLAIFDVEVLPASLNPREAAAQGQLVIPPMHLQRGDAETRLTSAPHRIQGQWQVGGQEQFYLEGQIAYALPGESGNMQVYCSTQHPSEMQHVVAHALHIGSHQVQVVCRRMGGGFGGKESQSALWAASAAIAAARLKRPVKLRADRDDDMLVTGKRHDFYYDYDAGFDENGRLLGLSVQMISRAGFSADLSGPVATRAVCHLDNAYYLSDVDIRALCARTNTQSNTAFRGFGGPQGALLIEYLMDDIARHLGKDPFDVRRHNFYDPDPSQERCVTHYGQPVADNILKPLSEQLYQDADYQTRKAAIQAFNRQSPVLKKGLALTPVKFGIAFNVTHLNQAGGLVHIYLDGTVLVNHGGTEMGQGIHTKILQVVAHELGISADKVHIAATDTGKIANTSATAASTGTDLNGKAVQDAAIQLRNRLTALAAQLSGSAEADVVFSENVVRAGNWMMPFSELVQKAYLQRIQLWSDGFYATPGIHWNSAKMQGSPFQYFAYGAALSEVIVDTLTGEWKLLAADLLYDAGQSLNPAIDQGQVEGGFIQGMGWLTMEELVWNQDGKLSTHAPSTYKIPAVSDCPARFNTRLFNNINAAETIHRSKAVGEPPLLLAFSVFFAIRDAIAGINPGYRGNVPLSAPATPEAILNAVQTMQSTLTQ